MIYVVSVELEWRSQMKEGKNFNASEMFFSDKR